MLVVAGPEDAIDDVREEVSGVRSAHKHTNVVVTGTGEGGQAAVDALTDEVSITTVDLEDREGVDIVGDTSDPETLITAGIEDAMALVVTVDDDATALLTIALARSLTNEIEILARVTDDKKVKTAFSAGADYVLSVQRATARLLASEIYGEDVVSPLSQIRLVRTDAASFAGQSIKEANKGAETGWVVIGTIRNGALQTEATTQIEDDNDILVAGTDEMIQKFEQETIDS